MTNFFIEVIKTPSEVLVTKVNNIVEIVKQTTTIEIHSEGIQGPRGYMGLTGDFDARSGFADGDDFSIVAGVLKTIISFTTPLDDDQYAITFGPSTDRIFTYESKTASGFIINANSSTTITSGLGVDWFVKPYRNP